MFGKFVCNHDMVFWVILSVTDVEIKQNFKRFSPKVSQMQPMENPRITQTPKINEAVYFWFYSLRSRGLSTSGPIINQKAEILYKKFPNKNKGFKADGKLFMISVNWMWMMRNYL